MTKKTPAKTPAHEPRMMMRGTERVNGRRCWAVQSDSGTKANGYPTFHVVRFDPSDAVWQCPCASPLPRCPHTDAASAASRQEREAAQRARDAIRAASIPARQDNTGPRWLMPTTPRPSLAERVREEM